MFIITETCFLVNLNNAKAVTVYPTGIGSKYVVYADQTPLGSYNTPGHAHKAIREIVSALEAGSQTFSMPTDKDLSAQDADEERIRELIDKDWQR